MSSPIAALATRYGIPTVDEDSVDAFLASAEGQCPNALLFFTGDPAQRSETIDVAVVLPERLAAVIRGLQPDASEVAIAADMDAADRPSRRAQFLQYAQRGQRIDRGLGETQVAFVEHRRQRPGRRGLDQADIDADAVQRDHQAGADQAATDDHDVMLAIFMSTCLMSTCHVSCALRHQVMDRDGGALC
jgi:Hydrogenase-1 expression protein HyaE